MDTATDLDFELSCTRGDARQGFRIETPRTALRAGEILALTGPSGSGKSTLLEMLGLILKPEAGSRFRWRTGPNRSHDIAELWRTGAERALCDLRALKLGFVLQSGGLVPFLTVRDNIALPRQLAGLPRWSAAVERMTEVLGIDHLLAKKPRQLSIGERQRVSIARALAHEPPLLLADEPTAALDPARAATVMRLLVDLVRERQGMAVIVTHDRDLIQRLEVREMRAQLHDGGKAALFAHAG
jgi:putative ABC transport system ATP-binding protein